MMSPAKRPAAALSLDLDDRWSYDRTRGDPGWVRYPSYLDRLIPEVLRILDRRRLRITFFIVGRDAALSRNASVLRSIAAAGHDIANHSFDHEPWLHLKSRKEIERDVTEAEEAIAAAVGVRPRGFRGPGFSWNAALLSILADREYLYDASTLPTFLGPLGRLYYFARARLPEGEKALRKDLFGGWTEGFRPVRPYDWRLPDGRRLLEIPVTTIPLFKTPFHLSYLLYLGGLSPALMRAYARTAFGLCRAAGTGLSFLLHPLDFLGVDDAPELRFFPAMGLPPRRKRALALEVLDLLEERFEILPMSVYAGRRRTAPGLPIRGVS